MTWLFWLSFTSLAQSTLPTAGMSEFIPVAPAGPERVIGFYNNGCILGAKAFATSTNSWELVNTRRNHQYGHSSLLDFTEKLGAKSVANGWGKLVVGDSSCPMGGKMHEGHNSHQVGLDVDIFYRFVPRGQTLSEQQRNSWDDRAQEAIEIARYKRTFIDENKPVEASMTSNLRPDYLKLLREAALDERVQRIFVSAPIKRELCKNFSGAQAGPWLAKIRAEAGHRSHFHVRLRCPPEEKSLCKAQDPVPMSADHGCGADLEPWFNPIERPKPGGPTTPAKTPPPECVEARKALRPVTLNETSLCLTDPDGSLRCRDYKNGVTFNRPKPSAASAPAVQ
jgi:penicillin-insensitive murein endopeptidase